MDKRGLQRRDDEAFAALVNPHRARIHRHCYRMLGSLDDADDAVQITMLRAWRGLGRFDGRSTTHTWLHRIATNVCLDMIARREPLPGIGERQRLEPYPTVDADAPSQDGSPEAKYEQREALELAFIAALQDLPPKQRAAFILRDIVGCSPAEMAATLDLSVASVTSALQRARRALEKHLPADSQQACRDDLGDRDAQAVVAGFLDAFDRGDVDAILAMVTEDATFAMPPYPGQCRGRAALAASWLMPEGAPPRLRHVETEANGQPAAGVYALDRERRTYYPVCLDVLTLRGPWVADVTAFRMPELFSRFGLPAQLAADEAAT